MNVLAWSVAAILAGVAALAASCVFPFGSQTEIPRSETTSAASAALPVIIEAPASQALDATEGSVAAARLRVRAVSPDGGEILYQWEKRSSPANDWSTISGATNSEYAPSSRELNLNAPPSAMYYRVGVTNYNEAVSDEDAQQSEPVYASAMITVSSSGSRMPAVATPSPQQSTYPVGTTASKIVALTSVASLADGDGEITYQWYKVFANGTESMVSNGTCYPGELIRLDVGDMDLETSAAGLYLYYLKAFNGTVSSQSELATITIVDDDGVTFGVSAGPSTVEYKRGASEVTPLIALAYLPASMAGGNLTVTWHEAKTDGSRPALKAESLGVVSDRVYTSYLELSSDLTDVAGDHYYYAEAAYANGGRSLTAHSGTVVVRVVEGQPGLPAVTAVTPGALTGVYGAVSGKLTASLSGLLRGIAYQWERRAEAGDTWETVDAPAGTVDPGYLTVYDLSRDNGLPVGTYYYRVKAWYDPALPAYSAVPGAVTVISGDDKVPTLSGPQGVTYRGVDYRTLAVAVEGPDTASKITYQWQVYNGDAAGGADWEPVDGATGAVYAPGVVTRVVTEPGYYRLKAWYDSAHPVYSVTAMVERLTDEPVDLAITALAPAIWTYEQGATALPLSATVTGPGNGVLYEWQYSDDGMTWGLIFGPRETYQLPADVTYAPSTGVVGTRYYRLKASDLTLGLTAYSAAAVVVVTESAAPRVPEVSAVNPGGLTVTQGDSGQRLTATLLGKAGTIDYQWEWSSTGKDPWTSAGAAGAGAGCSNGSVAIYELTAADTADLGTRYYRARAWHEGHETDGAAYSAAAGAVTVVAAGEKLPTITGPQNTSYPAGGTGPALMATLDGPEDGINYRWEKLDADGSLWEPAPDAGGVVTGIVSPGARVTYTPADTKAGVYFYRLAAWYTGGTAVYSQTAMVEARDSKTLTVTAVSPGTITVETGGIPPQLTATLDGPVDGIVYEWQRSSTGTFDLYDVAGSGTSDAGKTVAVTLSTGTVGTTYCRLFARDPLGQTVYSSVAVVTVTSRARPVVSAPAPGSLTVNQGETGGVLYATLDGPADGINYRWEKAAGGGQFAAAGAETVGAARGSVVSYALQAADVSATGASFYRVKAWYDSEADAVYSAPAATVVVVGEAESTPRLTGPGNVSYRMGEEPRTLAVTVYGDWDGIFYEWQRYELAGSGWEVAPAAGGTASGSVNSGSVVRYTPADTAAGVYYYRLKAWYAVGTAVYSATAEVEVLAAAAQLAVTAVSPGVWTCRPDEVVGLTATVTGAGGFSWQWQYSSSGDGWTDIDGASGTSADAYYTPDLTEAPAGWVGYYRLAATGVGGAVAYSAAAVLKVEAIPAGDCVVNVDPAVIHGVILVSHGSAPAGTIILVNAQPETGFRLQENSLTYTAEGGAAQVITGGRFTMPQADVTVSAVFEVTVANDYLVTTAVTGGVGGRLTADPTHGPPGTIIRVTAAPSTGYAIVAESLTWEPAGGVAQAISGGSFTMPASDVTVRAAFEPLQENEYTVTADLVTGGEIQVSPTHGFEGTIVTVTPVPLAGYKYKDYSLKYSVDGSAWTPISGYRFNLPAANVTVTGAFEPLPDAEYTVTVIRHTGGGLVANPLSGTAGTQVTVTWNPAAGYRLASGSLKYTREDNGAETAITVTGNTGSFTLPAASVAVSAEFETLPATEYTVTTRPATGGRVLVNPDHGAAGTKITVTLEPDAGYRVKAGSLMYTPAGSAARGIPDNWFTMPAANVTVSAEFEAAEVTGTITITLALEQSTPLSGSVDVQTGQAVTIGTDEYYDSCRWYLDGVLVGTNPTYTFSAVGKAPGEAFEVAVLATRNGQTWSGRRRVVVVP